MRRRGQQSFRLGVEELDALGTFLIQHLGDFNSQEPIPGANPFAAYDMPQEEPRLRVVDRAGQQTNNEIPVGERRVEDQPHAVIGDVFGDRRQALPGDDLIVLPGPNERRQRAVVAVFNTIKLLGAAAIGSGAVANSPQVRRNVVAPLAS